MPEELLRLEQVEKVFRQRGSSQQLIRAVDGLDLAVHQGESVGLVGESGSGKSTVARLVLRLLDPTSGRIEFEGRDITALGSREMLPIRRRMQAVFQDPYASLNAKFTIREVLTEPYEVHGINGSAKSDQSLDTLLRSVGLDGSLLGRRTHALSGGQLQRVAIARALALEPDFIVADEATSALDVSVQAQIVNLFLEIQRTRNVSYLFISHDLDLVGHLADRIAVMYLGIAVETAPSQQILSRPLHPYSQALISAVPVPQPHLQRGRKRVILLGDPPNAAAVPSGCRFHPRCPIAEAVCREEAPPLRSMPSQPEHLVACHFAPEQTEAAGQAIATATGRTYQRAGSPKRDAASTPAVGTGVLT